MYLKSYSRNNLGTTQILRDFLPLIWGGGGEGVLIIVFLFIPLVKVFLFSDAV